jgi:hypothetical protein
MENQRYWLNAGRASDLPTRKERLIYRLFEIMPGALAWGTLGTLIFFSWLKPVWAAIFIIVFDIYWLFKTIFLSFHLRSAFKKMRQHLAADWGAKLKSLPWENICHLVLLPMYKENLVVVRETFRALQAASYPKERFFVVLAAEERAGEEAQRVARAIREEFGDRFHRFLITTHPQNLPGEIPGKGSNLAWAAERAKEEIVDPLGIPPERIVVSAFDIDTIAPPHYFLCLTYHYLTVPQPTRTSYQPIPIYINNIWDAPSFARVVSFSATFWHMMQQERPERQTTFSSHSLSWPALLNIGFWQKNMVNEDSRIFWQCYLAHEGDYRVQPLFYPLYMDANVAPSFWRTAINQYKQQRRWGYGVENIPYFLFGFLKSKKIPPYSKLYYAFVVGEGFWSWATNALMIFLLGWLPLVIGGDAFNTTILSYNLPRFTRTLMQLAMLGIISSAAISIMLLPAKPQGQSRMKYVWMLAQWLFMPVTIIIFGALPGLEAQTRLMLGKYMGFWVTEKARKVTQ